MADEYTPTAGEVCDAWAFGTTRGADMREGLAEFDRWLAAHEAEVRERIAQDIARAVGEGTASDIARGATR